ncbi:isocitrate lyase/phosphoenolpyruvate mutase family protein [Cereibacter sp. SYSU M97828]|nr:isocitrate lyase/phosphoenolpyruvate mutase family protein [Cereibacter flavus]
MSKRKHYRTLLEQRAGHIVPGVYDALSARITEKAGFGIIGAGGFATVGSLLGGPDIGQSNMRDYAEHYGRICAAVDVPVTVDADTGFGDVHNVTQMVRAFERAGVVGIMISDQSFPNRCGYLPGKEIVPVEEMLAKVMAAVAARTDPDLVIIARTDAKADHGLDEALARCRLFIEAGADVAKPQGVDTPADIRRTIAEVPGPHPATLSQAALNRHADIADLRALGVATISLPSLGLFAAAGAVNGVMADLYRSQSLATVEPRLLPLAEYNAIVRLDERMAEEEALREEAQRIATTATLKQA